MKNKLLIGLLFASVSSFAMAQWDKVASTKEYNLYVTNIHKLSNTVKMWALIDYKTGGDMSNHKYLSDRTLIEFDCNGEKFRILNYEMYDEHMGKGQTIYRDYSTSNWGNVEPDSIAETEWRIACGVKE